MRAKTPPPVPAAKANAEAKAGSNIAAGRGSATDWRPDKPCAFAPVFEPSRWTRASLREYFFGYPGFFAPWNCIYFAACCLSVRLTNPGLDACGSFSARWILPLFARNQALLWLVAGGWHLLLYVRKSQPADAHGNRGMARKYDKRWPGRGKKFLFGHQTYENVFMSCVSGVAVWTMYEAAFLKLWANGSIDFYEDWFHNPSFVPSWVPPGTYSSIVLCLIPFWREFHFYWSHRFSHWRPLYRHVHYLHHKNVNPGPWSGLSMHPVEHVLYFSVVVPHMFFPCHPIHVAFNAQHTALTPAGGHHGFDGTDGPGPTKHSGSYFHYLHHRYFECNYGEVTIPLDKWFGTFRDGLSASDDKISSLPGASREVKWVTVLTCGVGCAISVLPLIPFVWAAL